MMIVAAAAADDDAGDDVDTEDYTGDPISSYHFLMLNISCHVMTCLIPYLT